MIRGLLRVRISIGSFKIVNVYFTDFSNDSIHFIRSKTVTVYIIRKTLYVYICAFFRHHNIIFIFPKINRRNALGVMVGNKNSIFIIFFIRRVSRGNRIHRERGTIFYGLLTIFVVKPYIRTI